MLAARRTAEEMVLVVADTVSAVAEAHEYVSMQAVAAARRRSQAAPVAQQASQGEAASTRQMSGRGESAVAVRPTQPPDKARVPVLMYHHIANPPANADAVRRDLSVAPAAFVQQMDYLRAKGYHTISMADLLAHLVHGAALPDKPIVLTFDDGYDDNYSQAYPILRRFGFGGTFFVLADFAGQPGYASWPQLVEMSDHGMSIEAHGRNHADLAISSAADAAWQIAGSRAIIEEKLGQPVRFYCYPSGRYTAQTITLLRSNGYLAAVTIAYGATHTAAGAFELDRLRIRGADTLEQFISKVETAP